MDGLQDNNYVAILAALGVGLSVVYFVTMGKKHPLEGPYVQKGIPIIGNFIEFAKSMIAISISDEFSLTSVCRSCKVY